jgi:hypothetical protein
MPKKTLGGRYRPNSSRIFKKKEEKPYGEESTILSN